eukprot:COSAG02_NODE_21677_length_779_cov_0.919118_2_plen_199_part_00
MPRSAPGNRSGSLRHARARRAGPPAGTRQAATGEPPVHTPDRTHQHAVGTGAGAMREPSMVGAYYYKGKKEAGADNSANSAEVAELRALLEQAQRQIRTLARETGHVAQVEHAATDPDKVSEVDPKAFGNTEDLKHGLTAHYIEKPFRELEEELRSEGGELMSSGSACDQKVAATCARIQQSSKNHDPGQRIHSCPSA